MKNPAVEIRLDAHGEIIKLRKALEGIPGAMEKASFRAVNRTLLNLRAEGVRIAAEAFTAKTKVIRSGTRLCRASRKNPYGRVSFTGKTRLPLLEFRIRPRKANWKGVPVQKRKPWEGISAMIRKEGKFEIWKGHDGMKTFLGRTRKGIPAVFHRKGKDPHKPGGSFGPGPIMALISGKGRKRLDEAASSRFWKNLVHETDVILRGLA